mmetsp:Transcript_4540/g.9170  ORF Transcript_4540/g.9170 Transcript_4540/m.9170 type:complete len:234 (+) Transcript_4540:630-1331(+)
MVSLGMRMEPPRSSQIPRHHHHRRTRMHSGTRPSADIGTASRTVLHPWESISTSPYRKRASLGSQSTHPQCPSKRPASPPRASQLHPTLSPITRTLTVSTTSMSLSTTLTSPWPCMALFPCSWATAPKMARPSESSLTTPRKRSLMYSTRTSWGVWEVTGSRSQALWRFSSFPVDPAWLQFTPNTPPSRGLSLSPQFSHWVITSAAGITRTRRTFTPCTESSKSTTTLTMSSG